MGLAPSDELTLLLRPVDGYAALAARDTERGSAVWRASRRPLAVLVAIGALVSLTSSGRFTLWHVLPAMLAWAFVPALVAGWVLLLRRLFEARRAPSDSVDLFFAGAGGWYLAGLVATAPIVVAPWAADRLTGMHWLVLLSLSALFALVHGLFAAYGFARHVWGSSRRGGVAFVLSYHLAVGCTVLGYYLVMGQLIPILVPPT